MCIRTVDGVIGSIRTVDGVDGSYRTVDGEGYNIRNVTGIGGGTPAVLLGTKPTRRTFSVSTTYTSTIGCVYFQAYLIGGNGGGAGGFADATRGMGGGGAGGACAVGFFLAGTYSLVIGAGGAGGAAGLDGSDGGDSTFSTLTAGGGKGGKCCLLAATTYPAAVSGVALNSVLPIATIPPMCGGNMGANGGCNMFRGTNGLGYESNTVSQNGSSGGGGCRAASGGAGDNGSLYVIEYF
jgi:hypothetical protein